MSSGTLTDEKINDVLKNYKDYFKRRLYKFLPKKYDLPFKMTEDDLLQEVMIKMWKLLSNKYDPRLGSINTFITTHIDPSIRSVIANVTKTLFFTGKDPAKRTQMRKIQKNSITIDQLHHNDLMFLQDDEMEWNLDKKIILREIKKELDSYLFNIFTLFFIEGYSQKEICLIINQSQGTISKKIDFIRRKIQNILIELDYGF